MQLNRPRSGSGAVLSDCVGCTGSGSPGDSLQSRAPQPLCQQLYTELDVSWFHDPKNITGALTTRLANDAAQVEGIDIRIG
ncbi:hypothetical protein MC885_021628 [Smutsia gigantea]|nr:hypothetical protein MC885_021628 [Smutsia gigantea]